MPLDAGLAAKLFLQRRLPGQAKLAAIDGAQPVSSPTLKRLAATVIEGVDKASIQVDECLMGERFASLDESRLGDVTTRSIILMIIGEEAVQLRLRSPFPVVQQKGDEDVEGEFPAASEGGTTEAVLMDEASALNN